MRNEVNLCYITCRLDMYLYIVCMYTNLGNNDSLIHGSTFCLINHTVEYLLRIAFPEVNKLLYIYIYIF